MRDSWLRYIREAGTRTLYQGTVVVSRDGGQHVEPAGISIRLDTVIILIMVATIAFGGDRAYSLVRWIGDKIPTVELKGP